MLDAKALADQKGLYLGQPYQRGKIPIVFVHGLMSSPLAWLEMINDLMENPQIRQRYQFWFFLYPTGNPILFSASVLRDSLLEARQVFDPEGKDPAFDQMVLVGHSMGGLLAKMVVQQSDDLLWKVASDRAIEHLGITVEQRAFLERMLFFEPLPFVSRIVFIAVPHRGSKLVRKPIVERATSLVKPAANLVRLTADVIMALVEDADTAEDLLAKHMPTGIGDLRPDNPVLQTIAELPMDPDVTYHSIIGNHLAADTPGGTDTVVPYESSHLEGAASERIVQSDHSAQTHPLAILEVKRILLEHLATIDRDKRKCIVPDAGREGMRNE
jgi:pimeloyl-ACP methyl ester carboxylesterase